MPVTKSAEKKLRQDKKKEAKRAKLQRLLRDIIKKARKNPSIETVKNATKITDKSAKIHLIHKNKAARIKSSLSKLIVSKETTTTPAKKRATKKAK